MIKIDLKQRKREVLGVIAILFVLSSTYKCNFLGADNKQ